MAGDVDGRSKLDYAVDAGLALAYAALQAGDRVGLIAFDRDVRGFCAPRAQRRQLGVLIDVLRPLQPRLVEADYRVVVRTLAARHRQRALLVVLTDFVEAGAAIFTEPLAVLGASPPRAARRGARSPVRVARRPAAARGDMVSVSRRLVLSDLVRERETALATLRRGGVQTRRPPARGDHRCGARSVSRATVRAGAVSPQMDTDGHRWTRSPAPPLRQ